jgi:hypothetical protein
MNTELNDIGVGKIRRSGFSLAVWFLANALGWEAGPNTDLPVSPVILTQLLTGHFELADNKHLAMNPTSLTICTAAGSRAAIPRRVIICRDDLNLFSPNLMCQSRLKPTRMSLISTSRTTYPGKQMISSGA